MAERAHPDLLGFRFPWRLTRRHGVIPWIKRNEYREAFFWRYNWASAHCQDCDVLEVPCGMGWGTSILEGCRSIVAMDISPQAVGEAKRRYGTHATFMVGDMGQLEFEDSRFDTVICLEGIEHVPQEIGQAFVAEAARVLRPQGRLLLSSPYSRHQAHSGNPHHLREYRPDELDALLSPYFDFQEHFERDQDDLTIVFVCAAKRANPVAAGTP